MLRHRLIVVLVALPLLAACASEDAPGRHHQSFGPGNTLPGMAPTNDLGTFQGAAGWRAGGAESYHSQALPSGYKSN